MPRTAPDGLTPRLRVGIGHVTMMRGGSEGRAMWSIEALKGAHDLTLFTTGEVDLADLNAFYGTDVGPSDVEVRRAPLPLLLRATGLGDALRGAYYQRFARELAKEHDVLLSTYNLCDFGVPAIQCIADFSWDDEVRRRFDPDPKGLRGLFHKGLPKCAYRALVRRVAPPTGRDLFSGDDLILSNSHWSADQLRARFGAASEVLYPPVPSVVVHAPPTRRPLDFVSLGRVSPEKRVEDMLAVLEQVRTRHPEVRLHLIGGLDDSAYGAEIRARCAEAGDWVVLHGRQVGEAKRRIMATSTYGIHARAAEPFGIAVAEMVKLGLIPFVPTEGGQSEIVGHEALTYESIDDAVDRIGRVLGDESLVHDLREHLRVHGRRFSTEAFMAGIRAAVEGFAARRPQGSRS